MTGDLIYDRSQGFSWVQSSPENAKSIFAHMCQGFQNAAIASHVAPRLHNSEDRGISQFVYLCLYLAVCFYELCASLFDPLKKKHNLKTLYFPPLNDQNNPHPATLVHTLLVCFSWYVVEVYVRMYYIYERGGFMETIIVVQLCVEPWQNLSV